MQEINKLLDTNEKIIWEGRPQFMPFFLSSFGGVLFGLIFAVVGSVFVIQEVAKGNYLFILLPHLWIGLFFVFGAPVYQLLVYKHTYYVITNKRVIIQKGLIGRDFEIVDFNQITNSQVNVGVLDKLVGVDSGSIFISTAGSVVLTSKGTRHRPNSLASITNPYEVFKLLKQVSHDVKTDIEYPNDLRPKENPGYQTEYQPPKS